MTILNKTNQKEFTMVRITLTNTTVGTTTMKIEGRIVADWIHVVESECQKLFGTGKTISLDLSGVNFVETEGVYMIRRLLEQGCVLSGCPLFIHHVLCAQT